MTNSVMVMPTRGPWWVRPTMSLIAGHLTIIAEEGVVVATVPPKIDGTPNYADAGLMAAAPHLIEALVDIQMRLNSKDPVIIRDLTDIISKAFEKIYIEADA